MISWEIHLPLNAGGIVTIALDWRVIVGLISWETITQRGVPDGILKAGQGDNDERLPGNLQAVPVAHCGPGRGKRQHGVGNLPPYASYVRRRGAPRARHGRDNPDENAGRIYE